MNGILYSPGKKLYRATTQAGSKHKNYLGTDKLKTRTDSAGRAKDRLFFPFLQITSAQGWVPGTFQSEIEK